MSEDRGAAPQREAPKLYTMYLPPSHLFWKMSDEEFERFSGPHVRREVVKLIPRGK